MKKTVEEHAARFDESEASETPREGGEAAPADEYDEEKSEEYRA